MRAADAKIAVADRVGLTEEQRAELLPSGAHARYAHRVGWAQDRTKRHGLTCSPSWGMWQLTPKGRIVLVDGDRLTALMIEHGVGISHRALQLPRIDADYFDGA